VFEGRRDNLFATVAFANALRYPHSISEEEGRRVSFTFRDYDRRWGSDLDGREYTASWEEFVGVPGEATRHHVVALALRGGLSDGDRPLQGAFRMGGPPADLVAFPLRGYPTRFRAGEKIATGSIEYRAPLAGIWRGPGTAPLFFDRVHAALFVDGGRTWGDGSDGKTRVGAGVEARLDMTLGYWLKIEPATGIAYGFGEDGEASAYIVLRALSL
jgi:outer membrane protein assembly factor BamA